MIEEGKINTQSNTILGDLNYTKNNYLESMGYSSEQGDIYSINLPKKLSTYPMYIDNQKKIDKIVGSYISYTLNVTNATEPLERRYSDFFALYEKLLQRWKGIYIPRIPPKKITGNLDPILIKTRMRLLNRFCLNLSNIEYLYKAEEANIFRSNIPEVANAINKLPELNYTEMLNRMKEAFPKFKESYDIISGKNKISEFDAFLKKFQKKIEKFQNSINEACQKKENEQKQYLNMIHSFSNYEKSNIIAYTDNNETSLIFNNPSFSLLSEKFLKLKQEMINPFIVLKNWLEEETLDVEAMQIAIRQINQLLEDEIKLKDKLELLNKELSGQISLFKGLLKKKEDIITEAEKEKVSIEQKIRELEVIIKIVLNNMENQIEVFKNDKIQNYYKYLKKFAILQLESNKVIKELWSLVTKDLEKKKEFKENKLAQNIKLNNEEKTKNQFENMCILGNRIKNEIIEEKKSNPERFIPIEEATKNTKKIDELFCIGLLAKNLENFGIITAIEKNPKQDKESIEKENTLMEYILDGLTEKKKFDFHFDFGEDENNKLLNNKEEQEKFNKKLKKKLSLEYNIPEQKIIITNPQKGSYQVSVIFMDEGFNTSIDANGLKDKFKNDKDFKEISYLKQIHKTLIMEGCKLSINMLDSRGNKKSGWSNGQKRGGFDYYPPIQGWIGFGLKVLDKYDNGNNDWIANNGNKNEWAVAYHGTGVKMGSSFTLEKATNCIINEGFKAGWGQAYAGDEDARHPGKKVGVGVYCSPNPYVMESYARNAETSTCINGINYMMGFMMRVKPECIRYSNNQKDYWVLNGTTDEMRPYRIMVKAHGVTDEYLTYITVENKRNNIGEIFHFKIKGSESGTVWGYHIYADDSNIAKAAVIEGLCKIGEEKEVSIKMIESQSSYESCFKNGVSSNSWGYWDGSYIFV